MPEDATTGESEPASDEAVPEAEPSPEALAAELGAARSEVATLEERLQRFTDTLARVQADYENYRKRSRRERDEAATDAQVGLVKVLVEVLDDIARARAAASAEDPVVRGLELVVRRIEGALSDLGVVRIAPESGDVFEPDVHEAMLTADTDEHPPGTVTETLQPGYSLQGRLVRPALVKVARPLSDGASDSLSSP